jgi:hypothetical protein
MRIRRPINYPENRVSITRERSYGYKWFNGTDDDHVMFNSGSASNSSWRSSRASAFSSPAIPLLLSPAYTISSPPFPPPGCHHLLTPVYDVVKPIKLYIHSLSKMYVLRRILDPLSKLNFINFGLSNRPYVII